MNRLLVFLTVAMLLSLAGCKHEPPTRYICLLDISGSIYPEEVDREFAEMQKLVAQMHRGDELLLYPITGNARNDLPGHILRLTAPASRTAYDSDLAAFRIDANRHIETMRDWAKANPGLRTDILGTLAMASQEIISGSKVNTKLVIMSDFLEDEGQLNFKTDRSLATSGGSEALAEVEATKRHLSFGSATVRLQRLRSRDIGVMTTSQLDAIETFWSELLRRNGQPTSIRSGWTDSESGR